MKTSIFLIHGVGNPQPQDIFSKVESGLKTAGIKADDIHEFNWNSIIPHPSAPIGLHTGLVSKITESIIRAAHLGFFGNCSIGNISGFRLRLHNIVSVIFQLSTHLFIFGAIVYWLIFHNLPILITLYFFVLAAFLLFIALIKFSLTSVFVTLRRIFLICTWPIFFVITALGTMSSGWVVVMALPFALDGYFRSRFYKPHIDMQFDGTPYIEFYSDSFSDLIIMIFGMLAAIIIAVIFFALLGAIISRTIGSIAKILADIFHYIAYDGYRKYLMDAFENLVRENLDGPDQRIIIIGHSLGSVIATDFLLQSHHLFGPKRVVLVTAASPINRLFHRFFPNLYSDSNSFAEYLEKNITNFKWINVYRKFDFIGGKLTFQDNLTARNICINKFKLNYLWGGAHSNYWNDAEIINAVAKSIDFGNTKTTDLEINLVPKPNIWDPKLFNNSIENIINITQLIGITILGLIILSSTLVLLWYGISGIFVKPITDLNKFSHDREMLKNMGKETLGEICYHIEEHPPTTEGGFPDIDDVFTIAFIPSGSYEPILSVRRDIDDMNGFDVEKIKRNLRSLRGFHKESGISLKDQCIKDVKVIYYPDAPERFDLPEYRANLKYPSIIGYFTWRPIIFLVAVLSALYLLFWPFYFLVLPLLSVVFVMGDLQGALEKNDYT